MKLFCATSQLKKAPSSAKTPRHCGFTIPVLQLQLFKLSCYIQTIYIKPKNTCSKIYHLRVSINPFFWGMDSWYFTMYKWSLSWLEMYVMS